MVRIVYSCFNNYQILDYVLRHHCNYDDADILLIDDGSTLEQYNYGCKICDASDGRIKIIKNKGKGIQSAISTAFETLDSSIEWIYFPQQDVYPQSTDFMSKLSQKLNDLGQITYKGNGVGVLGFEVLDRDKLHSKVSSLGYLFLSDKRTLIESAGFRKAFKYYLLKSFGTFLNGSYRYRRFRNMRKWFSDVYYKNYEKVSSNYKSDFPIELPIWVAVCINRNVWQKHVEIDPKIVFHMWFNDVAMQLMSKNIPIYVTRDLRIVNHQSIKEQFGLHRSSANAGRAGSSLQVEAYGAHLRHFRKKWGFDYEDVVATYPQGRYVGTLIQRYFKHDPVKPLDLAEK